MFSSGIFPSSSGVFGIPVFTLLSSGTVWTPTAGASAAYIELTGGGGGGGGCSHDNTAGTIAMGASGAPGNTIGYWLTDLDQIFTYAIGAGGTGGVGNNPGTTGGNTTFTGSTLGTITAHGGGGGQGSANLVSGAVSTTVPAVSTDGNVLNWATGRGGYGRWLNGDLISFPVRLPSYFGGGAMTSTSGNGSNGSVPGVGGSGALQSAVASVTRTGGSGANGLIRIWEY